MKNIISLLIFLFIALEVTACCASDTMKIVFHTRKQASDQNDYGLVDSQHLVVSKVQYYISSLTLLGALGDTLYYKYLPILVDGAEDQILKISLQNDTKIHKITFDIGVDSTINLAGAHGQDLDPMHGMYWTWQSGYINFKIEGTSPQCDTRKNRFQLHLGGYTAPYPTLQPVELTWDKLGDAIICFDAFAYLMEVDLTKTHQVMSPGPEASRLSKMLARHFSILQWQTQ